MQLGGRGTLGRGLAGPKVRAVRCRRGPTLPETVAVGLWDGVGPLARLLDSHAREPLPAVCRLFAADCIVDYAIADL